MKLHHLNGCAPAPLAHYLKALGILRLVAEQLDADARGFWQEDQFVLLSHLSEQELVRFFTDQYEPTPLVAPWNKGSGFFAGDPVLRPIETSTAPRFGRLREGIAAAKEQLGTLDEADQRVRRIKDETKDKALNKAQKEALKKSDSYKRRLAEAERQFKSLKADLIPNLRVSWRGPHREWLDAALVLENDGEARFPALLGTGGNDGRLDFTNNFFQRLAELYRFDDPAGSATPSCEAWIEEALFGLPARVLASDVPVGQFAPGGAGGANSGLGPDAKSRLNPADFVFMLEGAVLFTAAPHRRLESNAKSRAAAPFAVGSRSAGFASASPTEDSARGEQWVPLWSTPTTLGELRRLLADGRAQIGSKNASEPVELARAVARLGAARGIHSFQRFGYIERNGQSNLAVPLGRFIVPEQAATALACLDDLAPWLQRLHRRAHDKNAPARLMLAERRVSDAVFTVIQSPTSAASWQALLLALVAIEAIQLTGSGYAAGPIPPLRPEWVLHGDDGSPEFRLAVTCALQSGSLDKQGRPKPDEGVRKHWLTLRSGRYLTGGTGGQERLQHGSDRVLQGRRGLDDAIALVTRRMLEGAQSSSWGIPLYAVRHASASLSDINRLLSGEVDLDRTMALARALMAVSPMQFAKRYVHLPQIAGGLPDDAWLAIRLATFPLPLPNQTSPISLDPAIVRRLESGDAATALELALRKLRASGIRPAIQFGNTSAHTARLWAAALAFPIHTTAAKNIHERLDPQSFKEFTQ
jgi:CRISPR-associated protein Csx17